MKNQKHTPGPWRVNSEDAVLSIESDSEDCGVICMVSSNVEPGIEAPEEETNANAALIAAAPGLLEAAKTLLADLDKQLRGGRANDHLKHIAELRAAVTKAEGGK